MLLCVPIMVIINIILANFPSTRPIAILLSEQGNIRFTTDAKAAAMTLKKMKQYLKK